MTMARPRGAEVIARQLGCLPPAGRRPGRGPIRTATSSHPAADRRRAAGRTGKTARAAQAATLSRPGTIRTVAEPTAPTATGTVTASLAGAVAVGGQGVRPAGDLAALVKSGRAGPRGTGRWPIGRASRPQAPAIDGSRQNKLRPGPAATTCWSRCRRSTTPAGRRGAGAPGGQRRTAATGPGWETTRALISAGLRR